MNKLLKQIFNKLLNVYTYKQEGQIHYIVADAEDYTYIEISEKEYNEIKELLCNSEDTNKT